MRKTFLMMSISVLLVVAVMITTAKAADVDVEIGRGIVSPPAGYVNVGLRVDPSVGSVSSVLIPAGEQVSVFELADGWYRVTYNEYSGYLHSSWIEYHDHILVDDVLTSSSVCIQEKTYIRCCTLCDYSFTVKVETTGSHTLRVFYLRTGTYAPLSLEEFCIEGGVQITSCRREGCKFLKLINVSPGHIFVEVSRIDPTYHSAGTQTLQCDRCGFRDYVTIPMLIDDGMSPDVFAMGQAFMSGTWKLFGVYVPGFGFTFGGMLIGIALVSLSLSVINMIFGFGRGGGSVSARSGSTNKAKISKERKNDDH